MTDRERGPEIAVALDLPSVAEARELVERLAGHAPAWKVGLELFTIGGPEFVRSLTEGGGRVFLDLKLHDIPNTVARAVTAAGRLGVRWMTVHATGGRRMIEAAAEAGSAAGDGGIRILAVTILTSLDAEEAGEVFGRQAADPGAEVQRLAEVAWRAGVRGFVCSGRETAALRTALGPEAYLVTPGIRPAGSAAGDQVRVTTPAQAVDAGSDLLVIGRPITRADDPARVLADIRAEILGAASSARAGHRMRAST